MERRFRRCPGSQGKDLELARRIGDREAFNEAAWLILAQSWAPQRHAERSRLAREIADRIEAGSALSAGGHGDIALITFLAGVLLEAGDRRPRRQRVE